jgi:hypothetical protein
MSIHWDEYSEEESSEEEEVKEGVLISEPKIQLF